MARLLSVAQAVNDAAREIGISQVVIEQVLGSTDEDTIQMTSLLTAVADELLFEEPYQDLLGDGNWLLGADGVAKSRPDKDTDLILFDGRLAVEGLKYRFLQAKGLEFGEQMRDFTIRWNKLAARANQRVLDLDVEPSRQL